MSKEITETERETARKQLEKAIWGETANNLNSEKENKDMNRTNEIIKNVAFVNIFNAALALMVADKTQDEQLNIIGSNAEFLAYASKAEAAARKICDTYKLDENIIASKKFAEFCEFYQNKMSAKEIANMIQDEAKLNKVLDNAGKATVKSMAE